MNKKRIVIATIKTWNIKNAMEFKEKYKDKYDVEIITSRNDFVNFDFSDFSPDIIFFPHWSWKIPKEVYSNYECIVFHSTDLPFGRGGSPIQNLISRGIYETKISAIRVVEEMDAGDIYMKEPLSLYGSTAEEIFLRSSKKIFDIMIPKILTEQIIPVPQTGEATVFKRLKPEDGKIKKTDNLHKIYDKIRMLDAEGYPKAYIELDNVILEFRRAALYADGIHADVLIRKKDDPK